MNRWGWASIHTDGRPERFLIHVSVMKGLVGAFVSPIAMIEGADVMAEL